MNKRFYSFAQEHIAGHPEFHEMARFPEVLWEKMAQHRLFGLGIDPAYGGQGKNARTISEAGRVLVEAGGNLGIALSWLIHEMTARWFIMGFGSSKQKASYLPRLAGGKMTACFAVSEPEYGAHPKYLSTEADCIQGRYRINGEKTYLTNAPMAGLFIVIAVTKKTESKKGFTAFLVPRDTPGLTLTDPMELPFLRPSPHGGILLRNCRVEADAVLGYLNTAYETMVRPFRELEDTMMMGPASGGMAFQLAQVARLIHEQKIAADDGLVSELGELRCAADALAALAKAGATMLDPQEKDQTGPGSIVLFFKKQAADFQSRLQQVLENAKIEPDIGLKQMRQDITAALGIAQKVSALKLGRIGREFFKSEGPPA